MSVVLRPSSAFPPGTSVGAYLQSNWPAHRLPPEGPPVGAVAETKSVATDGTLTFTTLSEDGTRYYAYAIVDGNHRYVAFTAGGETVNASQPLDSDLTAIAALSTTAFGRSVLTAADAAALRTLADAQPLDSDLTAIAALSTTAFGRSLLTAANAAALRTLADSPSNAEAILDALIDAKGDLIAGSANDTPARLAVGTNGQVLTADSTDPLGVKWAAAASGAGTGAFPSAMRTGRWYVGGPLLTGATVNPTLNRMYLLPLFVVKAVTIDRLGCNIGAGVALATARLGIYQDNGSGDPGALLLDGGTVDASTAGEKTITVNQALSVGLYWLAYVAQAAAATSIAGVNGGAAPFSGGSNVSTASTGDDRARIQDTVAAALPNPAVPSGYSTIGPRCGVRVA